MTSSVGSSIRHTYTTRQTYIDTLLYTFEGNGAYKLKIERSYTTYYPEFQGPNGDVHPAKTDHNKATLIEGGKWSLQGNMLILRTSNLKIGGETIPIEKIPIDYAEQKFTVVWLGENRVELRYADKHKERVSAAPLEGQTNTSYTYLTDGRCRMYTRTKTRINVGDFSTDCETEVNETESPRILRRR